MEATFQTTCTADQPSNARSKWAGRVLSGLPVLFLAFDVVLKFLHVPAVSEASAHLGLPEGLSAGLGLLLFACTTLYVIPRTAPLGAVLLTGYLGGAVAIHLRVGDPLLSHTIFPVYVGAMLWLGLLLRDDRVRALVGSKRS
jgi:hypothetical protein